jgi:hypothetical protein
MDFQGAVARTDHLGVQLGPAAFQDEEILVRTLGHERIHVRQYRDGRVTSITGPRLRMRRTQPRTTSSRCGGAAADD